jgi:uncharacterized protein YutE (UPF0331/DUF86 family)
MTDVELVAKRLAFIETCVRELRELARTELIATDVREERFVVHTLQVTIQAALDVASHIVADERLGEPESSAQLFALLVRNHWVPDGLAGSLRAMVGFRNILVHGYQSVDKALVRDVVEHRLDDLLAFVSAIRTRLIP